MTFVRVVGALLVLFVYLLNSTVVGFNTQVGNGNASSVMCKERERQALLTLKQGFIDRCNNLSSWGSDGENQKECCKWEGVHCSNKTGHVIKLDLRGIEEFSTCYLEGLVPDLSQLSSLEALYLRSNNLSGPIPKSLLDICSLRVLDLSRNNLNGQLNDFIPTSTVCANKSLQYLLLSQNQITGSIPELSQFSSLQALDLQSNRLNGTVSESIGQLLNLEELNLGGNSLRAQNNFSGPLPAWIGELSNLVILILRSNSFSGSLPSSLCQLQNAQILDLSFNHFSGSIPNCLNNLTAMANEINSSPTISYNSYSGHVYGVVEVGSYRTSLMWKGKDSVFKNILGLVKSVDLSSNNLNGEIPNEIMDIVGLTSLNISRNKISGEIPATIGHLKSLDSLDLSGNHLSGRIPFEISQLGFLGVLNLSYNNLSGEIPTTARLQSFDASAYMGNPDLCGIPLPKCLTNQTNDTLNDENREDNEPFFTQGFYLSMGIGFGVGFWGVCSSLFLKRSWRHAYFSFLNDVYDKLYEMVAINLAKLQRLIGTSA